MHTSLLCLTRCLKSCMMHIVIISASRRTDIPAFYAEWFINRVRAGFCQVPNPFNPQQVSHVSLLPQDVDVIVFWTRNPHPLFSHLDEMDCLGYRYYFQYTLIGNPRLIDPHTPPLEAGLKTLRQLAERIGPERVIWRYDPVVFSSQTPPEFHRSNYAAIARALYGATQRSVISILDLYPKTKKRLGQVAEQGAPLLAFDSKEDAWFGDLMRSFVREAQENGMEIVSCAEEINLAPYGILPGKCIDDEYIRRVFGLDVTHVKDSSQRKACGCVTSKDIGMYDSCLFGCTYCYAASGGVNGFNRALRNHAAHDAASPTLLAVKQKKDVS